MTAAAPIYRIVGWNVHFENNRTRELKKLEWVPIPNRMDGDGYTELMDHPNGAAHLGAWVSIALVASKCEPRGTLLREGARPHDSATLARITRIPKEVYDEVIPRLLGIGWIDVVTVDGQLVTQIPQEGATHSTAPGCGKAPMEGKGTEGNRNTLFAPRGGQVEESPDEGTAKASTLAATVANHPSERVEKEVLTTERNDTAPPPGFARWWAEYPKCPRKIGRSNSLRIWKQKQLESIADQVIAALRRSIASDDWKKDNGRYIPQPQVWLNKTPWETDPADLTAHPGPGGQTPKVLSRPLMHE